MQLFWQLQKSTSSSLLSWDQISCQGQQCCSCCHHYMLNNMLSKLASLQAALVLTLCQQTEWQTVKSRATSVARNIASVWVFKSTRFLVTCQNLNMNHFFIISCFWKSNRGPQVKKMELGFVTVTTQHLQKELTNAFLSNTKYKITKLQSIL